MKTPRPINRLINHFERLPGIGPKTAQRLVFYLLHFPREEIERFAEDLVKFKTDTQICSVCKNVGESNPCEVCSDSSRNKFTIAVVSTPLDVFALERAGFKGNYHVLHGLLDPLNNIGPDELFINDLIKRLKSMSAGVGESSEMPPELSTDQSSLVSSDSASNKPSPDDFLSFLDDYDFGLKESFESSKDSQNSKNTKNLKNDLGDSRHHTNAATLDSSLKSGVGSRAQPESGPVELIMATSTSMEGESTAMYLTKLIRQNGLDETKVKITRIARGLPVGGDIEYADDVTLLRALEGRSVY